MDRTDRMTLTHDGILMPENAPEDLMEEHNTTPIPKHTLDKYNALVKDWNFLQGLRERIENGEKIKLNLGAGEQRFKGYIGVDIRKTYACDLQHDLRNPLPLPAGCASHVYCSHTLEHIEGWRALGLLRDWNRVLDDTGVLWGFVPDSETVCQLFLDAVKNEDEWGVRRWTDNLLGASATDMYSPDAQTHRMMYTPALLEGLLISAGFQAVTIIREHPGIWDYRLTFIAKKGEQAEADLVEPTFIRGGENV